MLGMQYTECAIVQPFQCRTFKTHTRLKPWNTLAMQTACTPNEYVNVKLCLESIYCLACVLCFTARKKRMNRIECGGKVNECNIRTKNDINDKITAKTITAFVCMRLVIAKSMCVNARTIVFFNGLVRFGSSPSLYWKDIYMHPVRSVWVQEHSHYAKTANKKWKEWNGMKIKEKKIRSKDLPTHKVYPSRWHSVSKLMNIVLVEVDADDVVLVCDANQFNDVDDKDDDDGGNDGNRLDFLRTFILLFIFKICSLLSLISRRFAKYVVAPMATFESIFSNGILRTLFFRGDHCENKNQQANRYKKNYYCLAMIYGIKTKHWYFDTHMFATIPNLANPRVNERWNWISFDCYNLFNIFFLTVIRTRIWHNIYFLRIV